MKVVKRRLVTISLIGVLLLGVTTGWWHFVNLDPIVHIPQPDVPNPNAYDYYVRARSLLHEDLIQILRAKKALAEKEETVRRYSGALRLLRQGFMYECCQPSLELQSQTEALHRFRALARLAVLEGQVRASRDNWAGAAESCLDAIRLGNETLRGASVICALSAFASESTGRSFLRETAGHLSAAEAKRAARRLEQIAAHQVSFADIVQVEKWTMQRYLAEELRKPRWWKILEDESEGRSDWLAEARMLLRGKRWFFATYTRYMNAVIRQERTSRHTKRYRPIAKAPFPLDQEGLSDLLDSARFSARKNETMNALLAVTFALRAYRLEHGSYPAALHFLTPSCLNSDPDDPFSQATKLRYKPSGTKYVLYSVGPDVKDDGGKPIDNSQESSRMRFWVLFESKGDVVAGTNEN